MMSATENNTSIRRRGVRESMGKILVVTFVLALCGLFMSACANDRAFDSGPAPDTSDPRSYFPNQAYSVTFSVTDASGQEIRQELFSATSSTSFAGLPGMRIQGRNLSDSSVSVSGTIFWDNNGVYHQADGASSAEALILAPLEVGANWPRWHDFSDSSITILGGTETDFLDGGGGSGLDITNNGGDVEVALSTSFPTEGRSTFYVAAIDDAVQSGSQVFSNCLQIINAGSGDTVNRYWYHAGDGLIKYSLNCQFGVLTGTENAELVR